MQLLQTRRPFVAHVYDGLGNELFTVFIYSFHSLSLLYHVTWRHILIVICWYSMHLVHVQVRRPFWWITSSIFVDINGIVCKPGLWITFWIFLFTIPSSYVLFILRKSVLFIEDGIYGGGIMTYIWGKFLVSSFSFSYIWKFSLCLLPLLATLYPNYLY